MKKIIVSFLMLVTLSTAVNAQNVNIPDANFKAYLVGNASINTNSDSEIQVSEASAYTSSINCSNLSISDLTGLEAFTQLYTLNIYNNSISTLDLSSNLELVNLQIGDNPISALDVSLNTELEAIQTSNTLINALDLTSNINLTYIQVAESPINSLNVTNGNNTILTGLEAWDCPNLTCISVDDVTYSTTNWINWPFSFDSQTSFSLNCANCTVTIPDANFKAYLIGNAAINTNGNTEIECSEANAYSGTISCQNLSISDMTGIESFTSLGVLYCNSNLLTMLDVSANTALTTLDCSNNQISALVTFTSLGLLYCNNNLLTMLDVSANTALTTLYCNDNQLTVLSLSSNPLLSNLHCDNNLLTSLDVTTHPNLQYLHCYENQISSLDISQNTNLQELVVSDNNLTAIDVTLNTALDLISIEQNQISSIDLSQNTALEDFYSRNTLLTTLDFSNNVLLDWIVVNNNPNLESIDLSNGNNTIVNFFWAHNSPNLTCIIVEDVTYSTSNWVGSSFNFDAASSFTLNCNTLVSSISVQGQGGVSAITTQGGTLQMEATVLPANASDATYTWSVTNGTGAASISTSGVLLAIGDGTVDVIATANDASGITGSATITISNQGVGIGEIELKNVKVYPNPVQNELFIQIEEGQISEMVILDYSGRIVRSITDKNANSINVSDLKQGVYMLKVSTEKGVSTNRFIKQ